MMKLNHLLAVTDLSAPARHAAERAALICKETGASLDVLHVAELALIERFRLIVGPAADELQERGLESARQRLQELAAALLKRYGVSAGNRIVVGQLLEVLVTEAEATKANLLVCGARGESFTRHLLLGSTAERMLKKTRCPMLIVKQVAHEPYRTALVPVDFSPSSLVAIRHAQLVAPQAEIVLLHAFDVPFEGYLHRASVDDGTIRHYRGSARQEAVQKLHALGKEAGLPEHGARFLVMHGDASLRVREQEQEQNCDLIVLGKHGAGLLEELLIGSVTKRVLAESQCDVLVSV